MLVVLSVLACRGAPPEPAPAPERDASPRAPSVHVIAASDHLKPLALSVGDAVAAPTDESFEWRLTEQGPGLLEPSGAGRLRAARAGETRLVARGEPVCKRQEGGCGTSTREWTIFVRVR